MLSVLLGTEYFTQTTKKTLVLNGEFLDMICAPSVGEEQVTVFDTVFTAVRYTFSDVHLKKD